MQVHGLDVLDATFFIPLDALIAQWTMTLLNAFCSALESIGIAPDKRKERNIVFHSWRHFFAAKMANRIGKRAMILTGHKSSEVCEEYADHATEKDFLEISGAAREAFSDIFPFVRAG
jgi:integrase